MRYLIATLAAPLGAFGGPTRGASRKDGGPARSAVVGLVSACLGIEREAGDEIREISARLGILFRLDRPGDPMVDYHTIQTASELAANRWVKTHGARLPTRREELATAEALRNGVDTELSEREYRTDVVATLVLWERKGGSGGLLDRVCAAMQAPVFVPYLGRRSCPLALPMAPRIVDAPDALAAISARDDELTKGQDEAAGGQSLRWSRFPRDIAGFVSALVKAGANKNRPGAMVHCDMDAKLPPQFRKGATLSYKRDDPRDRTRWLFAERREISFMIPAPKPASKGEA